MYAVSQWNSHPLLRTGLYVFAYDSRGPTIVFKASRWFAFLLLGREGAVLAYATEMARGDGECFSMVATLY